MEEFYVVGLYTAGQFVKYARAGREGNIRVYGSMESVERGLRGLKQLRWYSDYEFRVLRATGFEEVME